MKHLFISFLDNSSDQRRSTIMQLDERRKSIHNRRRSMLQLQGRPSGLINLADNNIYGINNPSFEEDV